VLAILWSLGLLGWLDFRLNMFLNVLTPLIMVISFSDSMQLTFAARDRLIAGESKYDAFRNAILVVGPACVLTHATAGLSFVALLFSDSDLIRTFGEAGLVATVIALLAVLSLVPVLGVLLVRREAAFAAKIKGADTAVNALRAFCAWIAARMVTRPGLYSLISLVVVGGLGIVYANLEPRYRLADQVPDKQQAVEASGRLDAKLTGANPIDVLIEFPPGRGSTTPTRWPRSPPCTPPSRSRPGSAMSGRSRRCGAGSPKRRGGPTSRRSRSMSTSSRSISAAASFRPSRTPSWSPAASPTSTRASSCRSSSGSTRRSATSAPSTPATRSRSPASRLSRRATAPT
jgi:hypothetical protein